MEKQTLKAMLRVEKDRRLLGMQPAACLRKRHLRIGQLFNYSKIKAFALCMQADGKDYFISRIIANTQKGLSVEKGRDYDNKTIQ